MVLPMNSQRFHYHHSSTTVIGAVKSSVVLLLLPLFMACNSTNIATALEPQSEVPSTYNGLYRDAAGQVDAMKYLAYNNTTTYDATNDVNGDSKSPSEIQKAVCTVTAGDVKASAEAVTTTTLKGVCSSAELHLALSTLESKLYQELHEIKILLQQLGQQNGAGGFNRPTQKLPTMEASSAKQDATKDENVYIIPTISSKANLKFLPISTSSHPLEETSTAKDYVKPGSTPKLKSLPTVVQKDALLSSHLREQEVSKFNNTMLIDRDFKFFTYYWKLENFTEHIESGISATVESPIFSIKGKALHIKAYFQHLHRDLLYLQLAYATAIKQGSQRNNIILDMGGLFKEIHLASDKVIFKHKITILNQNNQRSKDLVSQEFNNLETGFFIPNSALLASPYVKNNSLLIQIFLYL